MKYFISQRFSGRSLKEVLDERLILIEELEKMDNNCEIVNSIIGFDEHYTSVQLLGIAISKMGNADCVVFAPDWCTARGCKIEQRVAIEYNIPCYFSSYIYDTISKRKELKIYDENGVQVMPEMWRA